MTTQGEEEIIKKEELGVRGRQEQKRKSSLRLNPRNTDYAELMEMRMNIYWRFVTYPHSYITDILLPELLLLAWSTIVIKGAIRTNASALWVIADLACGTSLLAMTLLSRTTRTSGAACTRSSCEAVRAVEALWLLYTGTARPCSRRSGTEAALRTGTHTSVDTSRIAWVFRTRCIRLVRVLWRSIAAGTSSTLAEPGRTTGSPGSESRHTLATIQLFGVVTARETTEVLSMSMAELAVVCIIITRRCVLAIEILSILRLS